MKIMEVPPFVRVRQLASDNKTNRVGILPFSARQIWQLVKENRFPAPIKLAKRTTVWRGQDIMDYIAGADNKTSR